MSTTESSPSCPCCAFLPDDLFLPPSETSAPRSSNQGALENDASSTAIQFPSPADALQAIHSEAASLLPERKLVLVDTHGHPQLERDEEGVVESNNFGASVTATAGNNNNMSTISIVCAVSRNDWETTLSYASDPSRYGTTLPGLGVHPWYLYPDLSPTYLSELEELLKQHPRAILGEIGLCKVAKFVRTYPAELGGKQGALELQRTTFRDQFCLAARLRRPVSVHGVQQHGVLIKLLKEIKEGQVKLRREWRKAQKKRDADDNSLILDEPKLSDAFPTAIAMHSYTGTAHHVKELLAFEESIVREDSISKENEAEYRPLFYFGFSHAVNVAMCSSEKSRSQNVDAIRAVPTDRLLAESDVHCTADVETGTAGAITYLASATRSNVLDMADITATNGMCYLRSVRS